MGELVHRVEHPGIEHPVFAAIMGAILDEVVRPDVIGILGPQPDTRPVRQPEPPALWLFGRPFQFFAPPDPFHPPIAD